LGNNDIDSGGVFIGSGYAQDHVSYVTFQNNELHNGTGDGIDLWGNTSYITIEDNYIHDIIKPDTSTDHVDAIQAYGPAGTSNNNVVISGNFIYNIKDEGILFKDFPTNNLTVENNVVFSNYGWDMYIFQTNGAIIRHNTMGYVNFDPGNTNITLTDNIFTKVALLNGAGMSEFTTHGYNLSAEYQSYTPAGTEITGSPTFVGGVNPTTFAGYQLTTGSLGYTGGSDGKGMGVDFSSLTSIAPSHHAMAPSGTGVFSFVVYNINGQKLGAVTDREIQMGMEKRFLRTGIYFAVAEQGQPQTMKKIAVVR
jgi:hypothetical protein